MVLLAIRGCTKRDIARTLNAPTSVVEEWVYRYHDDGVRALTPKKQPGRSPTLPPERHAEFKARTSAAPREGDGVCAVRGTDAVRILNEEFGIEYSLNGAYDLMHRLGLSCLTPRPRHEKYDPEALAAFTRIAP